MIVSLFILKKDFVISLSCEIDNSSKKEQMNVYDEIKAVYSRKNRELTLNIYDQDGNLIVSSKMPKLVSYKVGETVHGPNNVLYEVVDAKDDVFNPKQLHTAILKKID